MPVLVFLREIGNQLAHDVQEIVLQVLQIEAVEVVRSLLHHDGAGGVMGRDAAGTVFDAGRSDDLPDFLRYVVKRGNPTS